MSEPSEGPNPLDWVRRGVDSDEKVRLLAFFRRNPGVVDTIEGLALRLAVPMARLEPQLRAAAEAGIVLERRLGPRTVVMVNRERVNDFEDTLERALGEMAADAAARGGRGS